MTYNRSKAKGDNFERGVSKMLSVHQGVWRRIPGSGSIGTNLKMSNLTGDLEGRYPWFTRAFKGEGKVGYGTSKQMTLKREWFTKVREQAEADNKYPAVVIKFNDVTGGDIGSATAICFNVDTWNKMMADLDELYAEYLTLLDKYYKTEKNSDGN
jgi:hypothetical protein